MSANPCLGENYGAKLEQGPRRQDAQSVTHKRGGGQEQRTGDGTGTGKRPSRGAGPGRPLRERSAELEYN